MTAPRIPRLPAHQRQAVGSAQPATFWMTPEQAPAAGHHQVCPPCTGDCQRVGACPPRLQADDGPQGAGEWAMAGAIAGVVLAALLFGPFFRSF